MNELETATTLGTEGDLDGAVVELVARGAVDVPVHPAIARRVEELVAGGEYRLDLLARLVTADPGLAGEVLAAANALVADDTDRAASVPQAIERLDPRALAAAALRAARRRGTACGPLADLARRAWREALTCGLLCRDLARARGLPDDEAFAAGLLHDAGRAVAVEVLERIARGAQHPRDLSARWWDGVVERYHVEMGMAVARRWRLPPRLADVLEWHHGGPSEPSGSQRLLELVAIGDAVVRTLADGTHVRADDAALIRALSESDTDALARTIDGLPVLLGSFDVAVAPAAPAPRPPTPRRPARDARLSIAGSEYQVVGFAPHQLVVRGAVPLPEGLLLEVAAPQDPDGAFHARVLMCWTEGDRFGAVLAPFALAGPAYLHWQGLVGSCIRS
ncbi:MAG TPA: HDOD domain-containing protein [Anaeromyxobacteraceae bacterium]|nr:HDOD domain-containing protein [Anaeromyxobacteraceae bacterium]